MKIFGSKAFLRAISIFLSVSLVKTAIDIIPQMNDPVEKILSSVATVVIILVFIIVPSLIPTIKRENGDKKGKTGR